MQTPPNNGEVMPEKGGKGIYLRRKLDGLKSGAPKDIGTGLNSRNWARGLVLRFLNDKVEGRQGRPKKKGFCTKRSRG